MLLGKANDIPVQPSWFALFSENSAVLVDTKTKYNFDSLLLDIQRNLIQMLNYKRYINPDCEQNTDKKISNTLVYYGMPDLTLFNPNSESDRQEVQVLIKRAIEYFEPRLKNIYVSDVMQENKIERDSMHFKIHADVDLQSEQLSVNLYSQVCTPSDNVYVKLS